MPNRLAQSSSPYLRQHADNPVDWFPWGEEALQRARDEQKPIFLSVGYSSCHWCHVMAHESFEDPSIGEFLNAHFVNIKVDREERPDVDDVYMTAVQLATGRGGWPMTLFLTPELKPFFAGTYFPPEDRGGYPGFRTLVNQIADGWKNHRSEIDHAAHEFASGLTDAMGRVAPVSGDGLRIELFAELLEALHGDFDPDNGGFGDRPKFPPHTALSFLLRFSRSPIAEQIDHIVPGASGLAREMAFTTLDKMALGGIHDLLGGGFHRYSTDARWFVPHFEKMLYDNAQLLHVYRLAAEEEPRFGAVADGIAGWMKREMTGRVAGTAKVLCSALDADSEGEEGLFYTWTLDEIRSVIGVDLEFEAAMGVRAEGNFEDEATGRLTGRNILSRRSWQGDFADQKVKLLAARATRIRPGLDDKAIAAWNGMAIAALSLADVELARGVGERWLSEPSLPHLIVGDEPSGKPYLDDIAHMGLAFHAMWKVTGESRWRDAAEALTDQMVREFRDTDGAFWFTSDDHERLIGRSKPALDQSMPSGNAVAVRLLVELDRIDDARMTVDRLVGWMERVPAATEALFEAALMLLERTGESTPKGRDTVSARLESANLDADGMVHAGLILDIAEGFHINGPEPDEDWKIPLQVEVLAPGATVEFPISMAHDYSGIVRVGLSYPSAVGQAVSVRVTWQACSQSHCEAPMTVTLVSATG
ncbi:MAG: thioredoxin domain-containing protein [Fimbriimonadaceae bacterium]|nr:thioredoxin domain-containing protein [Fimbriimonadaceae bacterium]